MSGCTKILLPTTINQLKLVDNVGRHSSLTATQQHQTHYYNQYGNDLEPLQIVGIMCPKSMGKGQKAMEAGFCEQKACFTLLSC